MQSKDPQIGAKWQSVKYTSTGLQHHGLYFYLKDNPLVIAHAYKFSQSRDGRNYVMIDLPQNGAISRHLSIDATYNPKESRLTPFHLTREVAVAPDEVVIQHAYISFAKVASDSIFGFVLTDFDAKKSAAEATRVTLSAADKDELRRDVDEYVMPILSDLSANRNSYLKTMAQELSSKECDLSQHLFLTTVQRLSKVEINTLIFELSEQQRIYAQVYRYEEHVLEKQTHPNAGFITEIITDLQAVLDEEPPMLTDSLEIKASKSQPPLKKKGKAPQKITSNLVDENVMQELRDLSARISQCNEGQIPSLSAEVLIFEEECKLHAAQKLIQQCNNEVTRRRNYFVRTNKQQQEVLQSKINKFKNLQAKFDKVNLNYIKVLELAIAENKVAEAEFDPTKFLEAILGVATICKQLQKQFVSLKTSVDSLPEELLNFDLKMAFNFVNCSLKKWLECAILCRSVSTIKELIELFPLTRVYLDEDGGEYAKIIPRLFTASHQQRSLMCDDFKKRFKANLSTIDFLFDNSSQFREEFLNLTKVNLLENGNVCHENYKIHAQILHVVAENGHEDMVKLLVKLGMQADRQTYIKAVLVFLRKLEQDASPDFLKYGVLLKSKVPDLPITVIRNAKNPNLGTFILFSSLLLFVVVNLLMLLFKPSNDVNEKESDLSVDLQGPSL